MSEAPKPKQVEIAPYNVQKADQLAAALRMSNAQMVNYLIESVSIEQITILHISDQQTKRTTTVTRRSSHRPGDVNYRP